jgi:Concanavalin A-like lectin/glucanases superfamily
MNPTKAESLSLLQVRKAVAGGSLNVRCCGLALGLAFLTATAGAEVAGYFKLDTFPGDNANFTDDTGKGLQGLLGYPFSAPVSVAGPSGQPNDRAVSFDGKGALAVDDSTAEVLNILAAPITLECWVNATNFPGRHLGLISYGVPGGQPADRGPGGYKLGIAPSGDILFTLYAVVDVASGVPYPFDGAWHHVAASYSIPDGGVHFFLDGQEVAFMPETREFSPPGTRHLNIGAQFTGLRGFEGAIDRVRISKAALTLAELDSVVATAKPTRADMAVFFNFDEAAPPHQGQGLAPAGVAISMADWVVDHPPFTTDGDPAKVPDTPSGAAGDLALLFGGADMAAVSDPNGTLNLDGDWTLEAWIKIGPAVDRGVILYYGHPAHGYSLSVDFSAGNKLQVTTLGIADMPSDTAIVELDVWQHVAVVHKKGQSMTYFINGVEKGTRAYTGGTNLATTTKTLFIGAEWDAALAFAGSIDRIRISNSALTATQLDSDPLKPAAVSPPGSLSLDIARSQSSVIVSWPEAGSAGYALEFSTTLANWSPDPAVPVIVAGRKTVTVSLPAADRNFRLKRP